MPKKHETQPPFDESLDDAEVVRKLFESIDSDKDGLISADECVDALEKLSPDTDMQLDLEKIKGVLESKQKESTGDGISLDTFQALVNTLPRIRAQRIQWVRNLGLDCMLARLLPPGTLFLGLSGIKSMDWPSLEQAMTAFHAEMVAAVRKAWEDLQADGKPGQGRALVSKFQGFTGKFGDTAAFEKGLEGFLGSADPLVLKDILQNNVSAPDSLVRAMTTNYLLLYCNREEYARVLGQQDEYNRSVMGGKVPEIGRAHV